MYEGTHGVHGAVRQIGYLHDAEYEREAKCHYHVYGSFDHGIKDYLCYHIPVLPV